MNKQGRDRWLLRAACAAVVSMLALGAGGCQGWQRAVNPLAWFSPPPPAKPAAAAPSVPQQSAPHVPTNLAAGNQNLPRVRLYRITLPLGTFSTNDKVWRQLDEDVLDSQTSVLLAQNGIRAAVAPQARWAAIAKLVDVPGANTEEYYCQTDGRTPLNIVTRSSIAQQTIFYIDRDLQLQGRTFDACDNAVRLSMSRARDSQVTTIQLEPIVQVGTVTVARGPDAMGVVRVSNPVEETLANLRLSAAVNGSDFLVLAPANPKGNDFSVGTRFLTTTEKVPALETVLVLVPLVTAPKK